VAVFVHGCYWHRCPTCQLPYPKANADFWRDKFERNLDRDKVAEAALVATGWKVVVVWEHDVRADVEETARRTAHFIAEERGKR
jgi:DNA mismatch endonuclease (patch repair protein)